MILTDKLKIVQSAKRDDFIINIKEDSANYIYKELLQNKKQILFDEHFNLINSEVINDTLYTEDIFNSSHKFSSTRSYIDRCIRKDSLIHIFNNNGKTKTIKLIPSINQELVKMLNIYHKQNELKRILG